MYDFLLSPVARTEGGDRVAGEKEEVRQGGDGVGQLPGEETGEEETPAGGEAETPGRGPAGGVRVRGGTRGTGECSILSMAVGLSVRLSFGTFLTTAVCNVKILLQFIHFSTHFK